MYDLNCDLQMVTTNDDTFKNLILMGKKPKNQTRPDQIIETNIKIDISDNSIKLKLKQLRGSYGNYTYFSIFINTF